MADSAKYTNGSIGECAFKIDNISKATRDFLVTQTSPWSLQRKYANISLSVGRQSKGTFLLFQGDATAANPTQPPNIGLTFGLLTQSLMLGNIGTLNAGATAPLKSIAQQVANQQINSATGQQGIPALLAGKGSGIESHD